MKNKKNLLIGTLLGVIMLMSVGYAALAQILTIEGTANVDAEWKVNIVGIEEGQFKDVELNNQPSFTSTSASFDIDLLNPGASATFLINIKNEGTINAVLNSITGLDSANASTPIDVVYSVSGITEGDKLSVGSSTTAIVSVSWNHSEGEDEFDTGKKTATITLNYVQDTD